MRKMSMLPSGKHHMNLQQAPSWPNSFVKRQRCESSGMRLSSEPLSSGFGSWQASLLPIPGVSENVLLQHDHVLKALQ